jgi:hypothetical protein
VIMTLAGAFTLHGEPDLSWHSIVGSAKRGRWRLEIVRSTTSISSRTTTPSFTYPLMCGFARMLAGPRYTRSNAAHLGSVLPDGRDYEEESVIAIAAKLMAFRLRISKWQCSICDQVVTLIKGGNPRLPRGYFETCMLKEHMAGIECIAFRQETRARELLAGKEGRSTA